MPERDTIWRIKIALNNTRCIAWIKTLDGTMKLLEMQCLQTPKIKKWVSFFKPWFTVFNNNYLFGMQGANNILAVQKVDLNTGDVQTELAPREHVYKPVYMMTYN